MYATHAYCLYSTMFCIEFSIQKSVRVCVCMHVCLMLCIHVCVSTCGVCVPWRISFYSRPCIIIATCTCILLLQPLFWMYMPFSLLSHLQPHSSKKNRFRHVSSLFSGFRGCTQPNLFCQQTSNLGCTLCILYRRLVDGDRTDDYFVIEESLLRSDPSISNELENIQETPSLCSDSGIVLFPTVDQ